MRKRNSQWIICRACGGEGKSSGHLGAFDAAEMAEDPDFFEDYMSGVYDRCCEVCEGKGRVKVTEPDASHLTDEELAAMGDDEPCDCRECRDKMRAYYRDAAAERRAEYLMSGAWRHDRNIPTVRDFMDPEGLRLDA